MKTDWDWTCPSRQKITTGAEDKPAKEVKPKAETEDKEKKGFSVYLKIVISVLSAIFLSIVIPPWVGEKLQQFALPGWLISAIVLIAVIGTFSVMGLAVNFITPVKNKKFALAVITGVSFVLAITVAISQFRQDYYSPDTGQPSVWVTENQKEYWLAKPAFAYSPQTGEKLRLATKEEAEMIKRQHELTKETVKNSSAKPPRLTPEQQLAAAVAHYTRLWGEPQKLELKEKKFEHAGVVAEYKRVRYFALNDFWIKTEKTTGLLKSNISSEFWVEFRYSDMEGKDTPVHFGMNNIPTTVYYWVEQPDKPPEVAEKNKQRKQEYVLNDPPIITYNSNFQDFGVGLHPIKLKAGETLLFKIKRSLKMDFSLAADEKDFEYDEVDTTNLKLGEDYQAYKFVAKKPLVFPLMVTNQNG